MSELEILELGERAGEWSDTNPTLPPGAESRGFLYEHEIVLTLLVPQTVFPPEVPPKAAERPVERQNQLVPTPVPLDGWKRVAAIVIVLTIVYLLGLAIMFLLPVLIAGLLQ